MKIYVDTSLLISLYNPDANSALAARVMRMSGGDRYLTVFGELEVVNALELRIFRKDTSESEANKSWKLFEQDIASGVFLVRPLPDQVFERARQLSRRTTRRLGTRTADLLHVAAAIELNVDYLYSFDQQQRALARSAGLKLNQVVRR